MFWIHCEGFVWNCRAKSIRAEETITDKPYKKRYAFKRSVMNASKTDGSKDANWDQYVKLYKTALYIVF